MIVMGEISLGRSQLRILGAGVFLSEKFGKKVSLAIKYGIRKHLIMCVEVIGSFKHACQF